MWENEVVIIREAALSLYEQIHPLQTMWVWLSRDLRHWYESVKKLQISIQYEVVFCGGLRGIEIRNWKNTSSAPLFRQLNAFISGKQITPNVNTDFHG